jgi:hypothetical protein
LKKLQSKKRKKSLDISKMKKGKKQTTRKKNKNKKKEILKLSQKK